MFRGFVVLFGGLNAFPDGVDYVNDEKYKKDRSERDGDGEPGEGSRGLGLGTDRDGGVGFAGSVGGG